MTKILCIAAPLSDTGKTVSAINLSAAFAVFEEKTLLVDCSQDNSSLFGAVVKPPTDPPGLADALIEPDRNSFADLLLHTRLEYLQVLAAGKGLEQAAADLSDMEYGRRQFSEMLSVQAKEYEFVILDTPTNLFQVTELALCSADELLIPVRVDPGGAEYIEEGLAHIRQMLEKIARLRRENKTNIRFAGILINCCDDQVEAEALLGPDFFSRIQNICLPVCIPEDPRLHEAYWFGKPAVCHDIASPGAGAFLDLASRWTGAGEKFKADEKEFQP
ncbi:MAG: ParA family protein [Desulfobacterales bacterium]|nr:ParA family protein [Desulfobacterales bacterium]